MKIVLVGTANPYRGGGIATFNERLALEFQEQGHEIKIYNFTLQYPNFLFPGKSQFKDTPVPDAVPTFRKVNSINPFNWVKIGRELYKMKPDIIVFRYWISFMAPCFSVIGGIARRNKWTKVFSIIDNVVPHEEKFYDALLRKLFIAVNDSFLVMNTISYSELTKLTTKPVLLAPHPVYDNYGIPIDMAIARAHFNLEMTDKVLLFFGFIRDYKGLDLLLKAMAHPEIVSQNIKLIIAGEFYSNKETYLQLAKDLKLNNIIWHNDFIPDELVPTFFGACNALILPYKNATQSGVTQVAFHFLKPMIATNVGGLADFVKDESIGYVTLPNVESLSNTILKYFATNKEATFIENLKIEKKQYEWSTFVQKIVDFF